LALAALRRLEYSNLQALDVQRLPDSALPLSLRQITQGSIATAHDEPQIA
jgi:hypothetical protein